VTAVRTSKIVLMVLGALLALVGFGLLVVGGGLAVGQAVARDDDGFYRTSTERFSTTGVALTSSTIDLHSGARDRESGIFGRRSALAVTALVRAGSEDGEPVFIGIARPNDVAAYLEGTSYDEVRDVEYRPFRVTYSHHAGDLTVSPPGDEPIWVASVSGPGRQELHWDVVDGDWTVVVMNADGSPRVVADVAVGFRTDLLLVVAIGFGFVGVVFGVAGVAMFVIGLVTGRRRGDDAGARHPDGTSATPGEARELVKT
jgi:hypothetical protein